VSTVTPTYPNTIIEMPNWPPTRPTRWTPRSARSRPSIGHAAYEEAGLGPDDVEVAEVYDLSSALELDWYEDMGFCAPGEAEKLLHDGVTTNGGRLPVNPSGGLGCFGEAVPAQAIAQVCELDLAAPRPGRRAPGPRRPAATRRDHRQPGPVRPRLVRDRHPLTAASPC
jgi:hypothetical protein